MGDDIASFVTRIEYEPHNQKPEQKDAFDEVVTGPVDSIHIERMDDGTYWMGIYKGDERQVVVFSTRGKLLGLTECDS